MRKTKRKSGYAAKSNFEVAARKGRYRNRIGRPEGSMGKGTHVAGKVAKLVTSNFNVTIFLSEFISDFQQKLQIERDDAVTEIDILKDKLEKAIYSSQKAIDERENVHKEFEKILEKYDR